MTPRRLALSALTVLALASGTAARAEFESETLLSAGRWTVELTHDTSDGQLWCAAQTTNRRGQTFDLTGFDTGNMTAYFFDESWELAEREVDILVDIDDSRWEITADADGISLSIGLNDRENASDFLREVASGSQLTLMNQAERRLAVFSLAGSRQAMAALIECWGNIGTKDPFQKAADPF